MINAKTWNPAQIDQAIRRLEGIIRSGSYNPAELNQLLNQLGEPGYINTWNPAELDQKLRTLLYDLLTWKTATGNPIQIRTNNGGFVQSCEVTFSPIQSGTGEPSPSNIRPISGWNIVKLTRTGKNVVENNVNISVTSLFTITADSNKVLTLSGNNNNNLVAIYNFSTNSISSQQNDNKKHIPNGIWVVPSICSNTGIRLQILASNSTDLSNVNTIFTGNSGTFTIDDTYKYNWVRLFVNSGEYTNEKVYPMIIPSVVTDKTYEPYNGQNYTATFDNTEYGGSYEFVSGKGKSEWAYIASYAGETITEPWISDRDVYVAGTTPSTGAEVCYKLATPTEITLTPEEIELLAGDNVLWTDGDNIEITYKKLLLPSDVESLSKVKKIEEKPKTKRSKKKKEE